MKLIESKFSFFIINSTAVKGSTGADGLFFAEDISLGRQLFFFVYTQFPRDIVLSRCDKNYLRLI